MKKVIDSAYLMEDVSKQLLHTANKLIYVHGNTNLVHDLVAMADQLKTQSVILLETSIAELQEDCNRAKEFSGALLKVILGKD